MKSTYLQSALKGVFLDGDNLASIRKDLDLAHWEYGVNLQLYNLYYVPPCQTSRAVLDLLTSTGKGTVIVPASGPDDTGAQPVRGIGTSYSDRRSDWPDATLANEPVLQCADDGGISARDRTGLPMRGMAPGTGHGSDSVVRFTSQDYLGTINEPGGRPDEVLLHELVHSLRQQLGISICMFMYDDFDTSEEFDAILVTNIYRSENGYRTLRANHVGHTPLLAPFDDDGKYYQKFRDPIDGFIAAMPAAFCNKLAAVPCRFNPIRRAMKP